jgi:D-alanyl-D-alanine dipeptidase
MTAAKSYQKPYQQIPIRDGGEPLVPIPPEQLILESPHPYQKLGAPYDKSAADSPYHVRRDVCDRLIQANQYLQSQHPNLKILVFDAYRPIEVQQFMVDYAFSERLRSAGLTVENLSEERRNELWREVYQFWAVPSPDPATPPPHSTGAAVDITLFDLAGSALNMGSPLDEISPRSHPDYFVESADKIEVQYHHNRQLLKRVMTAAGFHQHPKEWWHFSHGDQMWAWLQNGRNVRGAIARYGRY